MTEFDGKSRADLEFDMMEAEHKLARLRSEAAVLQDEMRPIMSLRDRIKAELERRLKPVDKPKVSEHALLRYIERVYGLDLETIREEILNEDVKAAIRAKASSVTLAGVKFRISNGVVVTVMS